MRNAVRRSIRIGLFSLLISVALSTGLARAQGIAGGSIGNDEKSLSGTRDAPRSVETPARRSKPEADEPRRAARQSSGGGNFDGAWIISGVAVTCSGSGSNPNGALWGTTIGRELTI